MTHDYRTIEKWLDSELKNWSRWCWLGPWPHPIPPNHCGSIEGKYIHERNPENRVEDERRPIPVIEATAKLVDMVWRSLPENPKKALCAEYPRRMEWDDDGRASVSKAARFAGIKRGQYLPALAVAVDRVRKALEGM